MPFCRMKKRLVEQELEDKLGQVCQLLLARSVCFLYHCQRRKGLLEIVDMDVFEFYVVGFVIVETLEGLDQSVS